MQGPGSPQNSFLHLQARLAPAKDQVALALFAAGVLWRASAGPPHALPAAPRAYLAALLALCLACLLWARLAPASWQRWRVGAAAAARLVPVCGMLLWDAAPHSLPGGRKQHVEGSGPRSHAVFLFSLAWNSGALLLAEFCIGLQLPPLLSAAIQLASTAALSRTNGAHCATPLMRQPAAAARLASLYVWLEPAIAPLEPLLWLSGVSAAHPQRRCHCVLLALQVWGGLVAPLLLVGAAEGRAYRHYRRARLRRMLALQRLAAEEEHTHWTRAAARRRASLEAGQLELSDATTTTSGSSGPDSPEAAAAVAAAAAQADSLVEAPAPPGLLLPGDWQYEAAYQGWLAVRRLAGWPALPLGAALCLLYAWHLLAYPW